MGSLWLYHTVQAGTSALRLNADIEQAYWPQDGNETKETSILVKDSWFNIWILVPSWLGVWEEVGKTI